MASTPSESAAVQTQMPSSPISQWLQEKGPTYAELQEFAKHFEERRIALGFSQKNVGQSLGKLYGNALSQTTICRFEMLRLSYKKMCKLLPLLTSWLETVGTDEMEPREEPRKKPKARKMRTIFPVAVKKALEKYFRQNPKPSPLELANLAESLGFAPRVVRVWFYNRGAKEKRETIISLYHTGEEAQHEVQALAK